MRWIFFTCLFAVPAWSDVDRFDPTRSAADQLVAYAEKFGVGESEITEAIWNGRFVPHIADMLDVVQEIDGVSCADRVQQISQEKRQSASVFQRFDCSRDATALGGPGLPAWNARFGGLSEEMAFRYAQRSYLLLTGQMQDPPWTDEDVRYEDVSDRWDVQDLVLDIQKRVALPHMLLIRSDGGGVLDFAGKYEADRMRFVSSVPSDLPESLGFVSTDEMTDAFGSLWMPAIFELIHDGEFLAVDWAWRGRVAESRGKRRDGWQATVADVPNGTGFKGMFALWALACVDALGSCGEKEALLVYTRTTSTYDPYTGDTTEEVTDEEVFAVPRRLAPIILGDADVFKGERQVATDLASELGCDSQLLQRLEENMAAYVAGRAPVHPPVH
ncbi:hypothetical protein [uncultured Roseobacter sp.]|uniref:hypothetical protein n=1 Tax=uncultured Roseobacter sp. TaxID=114847 RepID=UPI0026063B75|nr:hypothetical protein [uncultured Roseobacter sp.]